MNGCANKAKLCFFFTCVSKLEFHNYGYQRYPEELSVLDCRAFSGLEQNKAHKGFPQALEPKSCCGLKTA